MSERPRWTDVITALGTVVTAVAAIWIPMAIENAARTTRTVQAVNDAARVVDEAISKKVALDKANKKEGGDRFTFPYIENKDNADVRTLVFKILNEYEYLCTGAGIGVFRRDVIGRLRGDAIVLTWYDYGEYLIEYRKTQPYRKNAWMECSPFIKWYKRHY